MLNRIILAGNLTADPELRYTTNQIPVCTFTLAVNRDYGDDCDFINCVAWRSTAEFVSRYFSKGTRAIVDGRLEMRRWTNAKGENRITAEVKAESIYFGEKKHSTPADQVEFEEIEVEGELPF